MRVLLINTPVWKYAGVPARSNPGMGLLYIGAVLRENGHNVRIIDAEAMGWWHNEILVTIDSWKPTHVGIGCLSQGLQSGIELARLIKDNCPSVWVTMGGPGPSSCATYTLQKSGCDNVTVGEAELVLDESFSKCGITIGIPPENLDELPTPAYDLMEPEIGGPMWFGNLPVPPIKDVRETVVMWSRGCPHPCTFCSKSAVKQGKPRLRGKESIVAELNYLKEKFDINSIFVYDDELIGMSESHNSWLYGVIHEILEIGPVMHFKGQGRCSEKFVLDDPRGLLFHMKLAGFYAMMMGCESGSEKVKKRIKKGTTNDDIRHTLRVLKREEIGVYGFWMVGMPEETDEEAEKTEALIREVAPYITQLQVTIFSPLPGSEFFDEAVDRRWLCGKVDGEEERYHKALEAMSPNFQMRAILDMPWMSKERIHHWQRRFFEAYEGAK
jgi:anaerobic magnesium-protoporphyrin IX monomethyl ester cyclase